jgi:hypothetical protein
LGAADTSFTHGAVAVMELIGSQDAGAKGFRTIAELAEAVREDAVHGDIAEPLLRPTSKQLAMAFHQSLTFKPGQCFAVVWLVHIRALVGTPETALPVGHGE